MCSFVWGLGWKQCTSQRARFGGEGPNRAPARMQDPCKTMQAGGRHAAADGGNNHMPALVPMGPNTLPRPCR